MCRLIPPISQNLPPSLLLNNPLPFPLFSTNLFPSTPISSFNHPTMSDRQTGRGTTAISSDNTGDGGSTPLRWIQDHAPNSSQVVGFLSLVISAAILLILTWLTVSGATLSLIVFGPLLLITSPVWVPVAAVAFVLLAGVASVVGGAVAAAAVATWLYRYFTGRHPVGSDRVDLARSRIADTATHVKDYAIECGGYLQSRIKDAAPGA